MNQGRTGKFKKHDAPYSDGGLFFRNKQNNRISAIFIAFVSQNLDV